MSYRTDEDRRVDAFLACFRQQNTEPTTIEETLEEGIIDRSKARMANAASKVGVAAKNLGSRVKSTAQYATGNVKGAVKTQDNREKRTEEASKVTASTNMLDIIDKKLAKAIGAGIKDAIKLAKSPEEKKIWNSIANDQALHQTINKNIDSIMGVITAAYDKLSPSTGTTPPPMPQQNQSTPPPMPQQNQSTSNGSLEGTEADRAMSNKR